MERRSFNSREEFDPSQNFFTVRAITFQGRSYGPGQPFPKHLVEPRRLRQLYETRYLRQEAPPRSEAPPGEEREKPIIDFGSSPERKADKIKEAKSKSRKRAA